MDGREFFFLFEDEIFYLLICINRLLRRFFRWLRLRGSHRIDQGIYNRPRNRLVEGLQHILRLRRRLVGKRGDDVDIFAGRLRRRRGRPGCGRRRMSYR